MYDNISWIITEDENARLAYLKAVEQSTELRSTNRYLILNPNENYFVEELEYIIPTAKLSQRGRTCYCYCLKDNRFFFFVRKDQERQTDARFLINLANHLEGGSKISNDQIRVLKEIASRLKD